MEQGRCSLFKGEDFKLQQTVYNGSVACHPGLLDCVLRPLVRHCLMMGRSLCSGAGMGVEVSSLQLTEYILLSVSRVISEPTERRIRLLDIDCRVLEIS